MNSEDMLEIGSTGFGNSLDIKENGVKVDSVSTPAPPTLVMLREEGMEFPVPVWFDEKDVEMDSQA